MKCMFANCLTFFLVLDSINSIYYSDIWIIYILINQILFMMSGQAGKDMDQIYNWS